MANGYTKIRNALFSGMARINLNGAEFRVLAAIIRCTVCFHKDTGELSNRFLSKATGLSERSIVRAVQALCDKNLISVVSESSGNHPRTIRIIIDNLVSMKGDRPVNAQGDNPVNMTTLADRGDNLVNERGDSLVSKRGDNLVNQKIEIIKNIRRRETSEKLVGG